MFNKKKEFFEFFVISFEWIRIPFEWIRFEFLAIWINSYSTRIAFSKKQFSSNCDFWRELIRVGALLSARLISWDIIPSKNQQLLKLKQKFQAQFSLLAEKFGIPSSSLLFFYYGLGVKMTTVWFATVPCRAFFSGAEFLHSIDGRFNPFVPQSSPTDL